MSKFRIPTFKQVNWKDWRTYVAILPVMLVFSLWKPLEALRTRVWNTSGWEGSALHEVLAFVAGAGAAMSASANPSLPFHSTIGSTGEAIAGFLFTWAYVMPIVWLVLLKPAYDGVKWCWDHLDFVDKKIVGPLLKLTPNAFSWLPGAASGWAKMKDGNWFVVLVGGISYATAGIAALHLGWQAKGLVENSIHLGGIGQEFVVGAAYAAFILVAGFLGRIFLGAIAEGDKQGVGSIVSAAVTYATWGWLMSLSAVLGLTGIATWATGAVVYILLATYGFPVLYTIFASGFWKRVWTSIKPSLTDYFEGKETPFRHIALQSVSILLPAAVAGASCLLCATLGVNVLLALLVPCFTFLVAYAFASELIDQDHGNLLVDIVASLALAGVGGTLYLHLGYVFGIWGAIVAGIITAIVSFLAIPLTYCGTEWVANLPVIRIATNWFGWALPALHKSYIDKVVEPTVDACEGVYNTGYGHNHSTGKDAKTEEQFASFSKLTVHGTNGLIAAVLSTVAYVGMQHVGFLSKFEPAAGLLAATIVALFSVGLVGRATRYAALEFPGVLAGLYAGLKIGALVLPAQTLGLYFAVPFGLVVGALTFGLGFPVVLMVARALLSWAAPALNVPLDWVSDRAWRLVKGFWTAFGHVFEFVYDLFEPVWKFFGRCWAWLVRVTAPLWMGIAALVASGWNTCRSIWQGIFG